ncbi:DEP domain-containing protein 1A-like [Coregonus clupeaformis]|uniref:DEP domain-containing protein 1A-like n=1 Tax=Coregonus clupeaformis TaxID=59861 RepID=UPI001BE11206|nr:DEP domain-containing protein 1A-like [Coregonus clupeaformis]
MGLPGRRSSSGDVLGGSNGASSVRLRPRSCSLERILDVSPESDSCSRLKLYQSTESLASCKSNNGSKYSTPPQNKTDSQPDSCPNSESQGFVTMATPPSCDTSSGLLQPQLEQVAIEALQLCTLLLPPASWRKLQLLMRMISRMSQNVDLPRLHDAIATHTLMVHTFSHCMLGCEEEMDLDELLATRLVSFLMDHHQEILQVPVYLQNAVQDHINYEPVLFPLLDKIPGSVGAPVPVYSFCRRISTKEFEEQKLSVSQAAIADLLESLVKDKNMSMKDRKKNLKQFQRQYPDIYARNFPTTVLAAK